MGMSLILLVLIITVLDRVGFNAVYEEKIKHLALGFLINLVYSKGTAEARLNTI